MRKRSRTPLDVRFWRHVQKTPDCWLWTGATHRGGYGAFNVNGKARSAHRVAYELAHGPIPDGHEVCHTCDTPACVNPNHLFAGTKSVNMLDMVAKDRHPKHKANHVFGETHPQSKLNSDAVRGIRKAYDEGGVTLQQLAEHYRVGMVTVYDVVHRKTWQHVPD